ncbi:MAG: LytR C-terminal domain-containing protein [Rhodoglobus sp.]
MAYPEDRFDHLPDDLHRIGAHRSPEKTGRAWIGLAWAALATLILVVVGLFALRTFTGIDFALPLMGSPQSPSPSATSSPAPTAEPVLDPNTLDPNRKITVSIYNGTPTEKLQNTVGSALADEGWVINTEALAAANDEKKTTVFYSDAANEDVARGLVATLGIGDIRLVPAETFPGSPIAIVIGLDYPGAATEG